MPAESCPPALARLVDFAERPRIHEWSLRAALCRYAQPQPERVSRVLDLVRRSEAALRPHAKLLERDGEALWAAVEGAGGDGDADGNAAGEPARFVTDLLRAVQHLDRLGDLVAAWASDRSTPRPDAAVDAVVTEVTECLEALGVPHEERPRPPRQR